MEYLQICVFIILLAGFSTPVRGQCDGSTPGKIKSPNFGDGGEYGKAANCSLKLSPLANGKEYALVLNVTLLKLYVVKNGKKHCLESYNLIINNEKTTCDRYVRGQTTEANGTIIPANYFCNAYYDSPACADISQIQGCETQQKTNFPVLATYFSDGRNDSDVASTSMYFSISYEFIECPERPTTTSTPKPVTTKNAGPATNAPTSDPSTIEITTVPLSDKATINPPTQAQAETEETTLPTTQTSMNSVAVTKKTDVTTTTGDGGNFDQQQDMIIIIAAAAGGGGLIAIVSIVLIVVTCKRKRKVSITEPGHNGEVAMEEVNHSDGDGGANENGTRASQHGGPTIPEAELYATVSEPGQSPQRAIATGSTEPGSESTQPIAELYATVSKPPRLTEAKSQQPQDEPVTAPNQPESCLYATVSKPPRVTEQPQSSQPQDEHVTAPEQPEACLYAAVSIKKKGGKETIHYNKDMVDNVLYGTSENYK